MKHSKNLLILILLFFNVSCVSSQDSYPSDLNNYDDFLSFLDQTTPHDATSCVCDDQTLGSYQKHFYLEARFYKKFNVPKFCCNRYFSVRLIKFAFMKNLVLDENSYYGFVEIYQEKKEDEYCHIRVNNDYFKINSCRKWIDSIRSNGLFMKEGKSFVQKEKNSYEPTFYLEMYDSQKHWFWALIQKKEIDFIYQIVVPLTSQTP